jgi:kynurenine formamidase
VSAAEVEAELARIGHKLEPLDIVVVNTAAGKKYGEPDYVDSGCGMGREATLYLTSRGVRVTGTDGWSWDAPFVHSSPTRGAEPSMVRCAAMAPAMPVP